MYIVFSFVAGLVFGFGLIVSQMISPVKVQSFLTSLDAGIRRCCW